MKELQYFLYGLSFGQRQVVYAATAITSVILIVVGIRAWVKMFSSKEIAKWPFHKKQFEFTIHKKGYYSIYIHGRLYKTVPGNWYPKIIQKETSAEINVRSSFFGVQSTGFKGGRSELFGFRIKEAGSYSLTIHKGTHTALGSIRNKIRNAIAPITSADQEKDIFLTIRNGNSLLAKALLFPQMFLVFVGMVGIILGLILMANPAAFN